MAFFLSEGNRGNLHDFGYDVENPWLVSRWDDPLKSQADVQQTKIKIRVKADEKKCPGGRTCWLWKTLPWFGGYN